MERVIYQADGWTITQDPTRSDNNNLVRFHRTNGQRKLLDQIALWDPIAEQWSGNRWLPRSVPTAVLAVVKARMRGVGQSREARAQR